MASPTFSMPTFGGASNTLAPAQLYAGSTNSTGMQMPTMGSTKNTLAPAASSPAPPQMPSASGSSSTAPFGTTSSGLSVSPNPSGSPTGTGSTGAPGTNTGTMSGLTSQQAADVLAGNQSEYGTGAGALLTNYLQTGAGYNGALAQQTVSATTNAMQQQINQQYGNLQTSFANAGLSPNSSAAALASSQFLSNASAQENMIAAEQYTQMYSQSQQDYLSALETELGQNNSAVSAGIFGTYASGIGSVLSGIGGSAYGIGNLP